MNILNILDHILTIPFLILFSPFILLLILLYPFTGYLFGFG